MNDSQKLTLIGAIIATIIIYLWIVVILSPIIIDKESTTQVSKILHGDLPECDPTLKATEGYGYYCKIENISMWCKVEPQRDEHLKNIPTCQPVVLR
jgi:hypothetical protein